MIDFFIIQNKVKVPEIYTTSNKEDKGIVYRPCTQSLEKQAKELGIIININVVELNNVPTSTKSLLVGFLCENNLIPDDYLARILSMNNLYRSANGFLGDHRAVYNSNHEVGMYSDLINVYHKREIGNTWNKNTLMEYTDEIKMPLIYGAIFNGHYYNSRGGFTPTLTARTISPASLSLINTENQLVWAKKLDILEFLPITEINKETFGNWFYELGYFSKEKHDTNPELLLLKCKHKIESPQRKTMDFLCWIYDTGCYESFIGYKLG